LHETIERFHIHEIPFTVGEAIGIMDSLTKASPLPVPTLPADAYTRPEIFAEERARIFTREWSLFTWSERLADPGRYVAATLAGYPLLVLRDGEGGLRGFHNVCRHRAAMLVREGEGQISGALVCPYHTWAYGLDGQLRKATGFGPGAEAIDRCALNLFPVAVAEWRGLIFVRIAPDGPSLTEWLGRIVPMAAHYPLEQQHYFMRKEQEIAVDWKVYGENYLECYHCRSMHPGLCAALDIDRYTIEVHDDERFFHLYGPKRDGGMTEGLYFYKFPFLMLNLYEWGSSIATVEPLGPGRMRHINWYFFTDISAARAEANRQSAEWSAQIVAEDIDMVVGVQRNLNTGIYRQGLLSPEREEAVAAFQGMVRDALAGSPVAAALGAAS
jgi:phenylpropionate dioxygenase-like ring-hydroxylating dioxygenase large terminal subunit